ncbi:complement factor H-related protein 1-like isoform X3 [Paramisgurnus dabryanus]|uniref:complement factor H-related protein 1-like isoform X3 n=1 Tax=Paramisgurnus dabryanus TaxID=90735 RepID=UPI0031F3670C
MKSCKVFLFFLLLKFKDISTNAKGVDECDAFPSIQHGQLNNHTEQSAVVKCDPGFKPSHTVIRCVNGTWQTSTCELAFCSKPLQEVNNATLIDQIQGERKYSHGDTAHYECDEDYESNGQTIAKCDGPAWIYSECISSICPPPPMIENGDFNVERTKDEVIISVSYSCQSNFVPNKQQSYHRCLNGVWDTPPKCLKPCKITPDIYKEHNLKLIQNDYLRHSARFVKLPCNSKWNVGGFSRQLFSIAFCTDGELRFEVTCKEQELTK